MRVCKQSTAVNISVFMTDSSDHLTGKTGLTLTIRSSKAAAAFATITPTVTEQENGWYKLALTSGHTDTAGDLAFHVTGTGADPLDFLTQVVAYDPTDSAALGLSRIDAAISSRSTYAGADTSGTMTLLSRIGGSITISGGKVAATIAAGDIANGAITAASIASAALTIAKFGAGIIPAIDYGAIGMKLSAATEGPGTDVLIQTITSDTLHNGSITYEPFGQTDPTIAADVGVSGNWIMTDSGVIWDGPPITLPPFGVYTWRNTSNDPGISNRIISAFPLTLADMIGTSTSTLPTGAAVAAVNSKTTNLPAAPASTTNITAAGGVSLSAAGLDLVLPESGINARQALSLVLAACCGKVTGAGTTTITIKNANGTTTRISATVDSSGNRSAVTLTPPA